MPTPEQKYTLVPVGRVTLEEAASTEQNLAVPALFQDSNVAENELFRLHDDEVGPNEQWTSRLHAALRVTRLQHGIHRLEVRDVGNFHSLRKTRIINEGQEVSICHTKWYELKNGSIVLFNGWDGKENDYKVFMYNVVIPPTSSSPLDVEITGQEAPLESADDSDKVSKLMAQMATLQKDFDELSREKSTSGSRSEQKQPAQAESPLPQSDGPHTLKIIIPNKYVGGVIGHGGARLRQLQTDLDCNIDISRQEEYHSAAVDLQGRACLIRGLSTREDLRLAVTNVISAAGGANAQGRPGLNVNRDGINIAIPAASSGELIGPGGVRLATLKKESGLRELYLGPKGAGSDERLLFCLGCATGIDMVIKVVSQMLGPSPSGYNTGTTSLTTVSKKRALSPDMDEGHGSNANGRSIKASRVGDRHTHNVDEKQKHISSRKDRSDHRKDRKLTRKEAR